MDYEIPSLVATRISLSDKYLSRKAQSSLWYSWPFIKGGGRSLARSCTSRKFEWINYIIVDIIDMILLEPQLLLKVGAQLRSADGVSRSVCSIHFGPAWFVNGKDFYLFSFPNLITVFYFIQADIWIKLKGFIQRRRLYIRLGCWGLNFFKTDSPCHLFFSFNTSRL